MLRRNDEKEEVFVNQFVAPPRREEIQISEKEKKKKIGKRLFDKNKSVFKDWKEDTQRSLALSFAPKELTKEQLLNTLRITTTNKPHQPST